MPPQLPVRANALKQLLLKPSVNPERQLIFRASSSHPQKRQPHALNCRRNFSQSSPSLKKKSVADREAKAKVAEDLGPAQDPNDFSTLDSAISSAVETLESELLKLRTGGRFNPEALEDLRVRLVNGKPTEKLRDLAQVLPKGGRNLMILVGEKEHVKAIVSAIQGSKDLNLQPQPDPHNPSQLNIQIPPPTKESRDLALAAASKAGEDAKLRVKNARAAMQKRFRTMSLSKVAVQPDVLKKAQKKMEDVVDKANQRVKKIVDDARKAMEKA